MHASKIVQQQMRNPCFYVLQTLVLVRLTFANLVNTELYLFFNVHFADYIY